MAAELGKRPRAEGDLAGTMSETSWVLPRAASSAAASAAASASGDGSGGPDVPSGSGSGGGPPGGDGLGGDGPGGPPPPPPPQPFGGFGLGFGLGVPQPREIVADPKLLDKPGSFDGSASAWPEFKFRFSAWLNAIDARAAVALQEAEVRDQPIVVPEQLVRLGGFLYAALVTSTSGVATQIIRSVSAFNGWEAWRLLVAEYEPKLTSRRLALLTHLLEPDFGSETECLQRYLAWEREAAHCESVVGAQLSEKIKIAVVMRKAPQALQRHLQLHAAEVGGSFERFRAAFLGFLQARRTWASADASAGGTFVPMEIDQLATGSRSPPPWEEEQPR